MSASPADDARCRTFVHSAARRLQTETAGSIPDLAPMEGTSNMEAHMSFKDRIKFRAFRHALTAMSLIALVVAAGAGRKF